MKSMKLLSALALALSLGAVPAFAQSQGVDSDKVLFGSSMDMTGPNGASVTEVIFGAKLAFQVANSAGGINGRNVEIIHMDDAFVKDKAVANVKALNSEKKVFALIGGTGSGIIPAIMPELIEMKLPMVGAYAGGVAKMREEPNRYFFNTNSSYTDEAMTIVGHFTGFGQKEFVMVVSDDGFGKAVLASFQKAAKAKGATIKQEVFLPADFNGEKALASVKDLPGSLPVVFGGSPKHAFGFFPGFRKAHDNQIYGVSTVGNIYKTLGQDAVGWVIAQVAPPVLDKSSGLAMEYSNAVAKHGKNEQEKKLMSNSMAGFVGYMQAKIALTGLKKAGKSPTRESFVDALETMKDEDIGGIFVNYEKGKVHMGNQYVELIMIGKNGEMIY